AEDGIRDDLVTGVQTCALPISPDALPDWLERGARHVMAERPPWEAEIPVDRLAAAPFGKLVISGGHSPAFDTVCDVVAERIGARDRKSVVIGKEGRTRAGW